MSSRQPGGHYSMFSDFAQLSALHSTDAEYRFGRPKVYLTPRELARLSVVRSRLGDTQAERLANAAGTRGGRRARSGVEGLAAVRVQAGAFGRVRGSADGPGR